MPIQLDSVGQLQTYLMGVIGKARHHAPEIEEVILTLAGAVVLFKDTETPLEARSWRGNLANVLWATRNSQRYAFSYNQSNRQISIKRGSTRGIVVASFDNQTPTDQVIDIFRHL